MVGNDEQQSLEKLVSEMLTDGDMEREEPQEGAVKRLSPKYEIRIQTHIDPIAEETRQYRKLAEEVDDRYDRYMAQRSDDQDSEDRE